MEVSTSLSFLFFLPLVFSLGSIFELLQTGMQTVFGICLVFVFVLFIIVVLFYLLLLLFCFHSIVTVCY